MGNLMRSIRSCSGREEGSSIGGIAGAIHRLGIGESIGGGGRLCWVTDASNFYYLYLPP